MSATSQPLRAVLVTGASTGIGEATAMEMARRGWRVFAGVRRDEDAERLAGASQQRIAALRLDVTSAEQIAAAAEALRGQLDAGLDGLVNNAGIVVAGPLELLPIEQIHRQFEVNVFGQLAVIQAMLPLLRQARGRIVNVSSVSGLIASPFLGPYCGSKFALEAMSDSLRIELRRSGVSVSVVAPGPVQTPIWKKSGQASDSLRAQMPPEGSELYQSDLADFERAVRRIAENSAPVEDVVRQVVHALAAPRPRTRYFLYWYSRPVLNFARLLPDRWRDRIVARAGGLR